MYTIDNTNETFKTLKEAKWHLEIAYTKKERIKYFHKEAYATIWKVKKDIVVTATRILTDDDGNLHFSRTVKI